MGNDTKVGLKGVRALMFVLVNENILKGRAFAAGEGLWAEQ